MALDQAVLWQELGWTPTPEQQQQLEELQGLLRHWNSRLNLTRLVEGDDYWISQVFDSIWPLVPVLKADANAPLRIVDVGTGGGFPGLAIAIAMPQAKLTLVDSVGRKVEAVAAMAEALGMQKRVESRCERIEQTGRQPLCRGQFDWALARAVAKAPVVAEYLVPLLARGGRALLYRGQWEAADQKALEQAAASLNSGIEACLQRELPQAKGLRHALILNRLGPCPKAYPRAVGIPSKQPLS
ncbi:16S rRNA (guanine(527)-N(7))-methyltransferase RsmG [Cyanobium sp. HWJ4-Hawea]|uniref:16S rRNA (guanine(527)-N(7))-methyltransferase RsmG n=1 Tax=Cyanobium sp. HWJ4-Hawea TaxID=2823713 RepID=UPI0020CED5BB|nr:16S rRNA (guanine(527)-N(7))-methyltransferase RsmG [Cyanobium sp. HWJ4-Hawea]MCP9809964.1 16S rRNA (guanine(527)-N(7))-methyltransferase RsmG [Cyanobium sp. HWJ4-Hawea]